MNYSDLTIIIPTFNEGESIEVLIKKIISLYPRVYIIISDDGSTDKTKEKVDSFKKNNVVFLDRSKKKSKGLTASVIDGIIRCSTRFFVVMDGDLQHPPSSVKLIFQKLSEGNLIVIASRKKVDADWSIIRRIISHGAIFIGWLRLLPNNYSEYDLMSGFFGMDTSIARKVILKNEKRFIMGGYKILFDLLKILNFNTDKIAKIDYVFGSRKFGHSKLGKKHIIYFLKSLVS